METKQISATLAMVVVNKIQEMADEQGRSFSWMVNHLLTQAALADKIKKG